MKVGDKVCLTDYPECTGTVLIYDYLTDRFTVEWHKSGLVNSEPRENLTILTQLPVGAADKYCLHDWVRYTGITQSYWFCTKCDAKKELHDDIRRGHYS